MHKDPPVKVNPYEKAVAHLQKDKKLGRIIKQVGNCQIRVIENKFEALVDGIITQQVSDAAGKAIASRFRDLFGGNFPRPHQVLEKKIHQIKKAGLSRMKAEYIYNIAEIVDSKKIDFEYLNEQDDEQIISELVKIRGIGRWTAEMFLIFGMGRQDILPLGDLGLRNGIAILFDIEKPTDVQITKIASNWRPYRTIATWYIWKGVKNFKNV
ncbi:MAG: DNA-3-methyladenine glycosylase 2 family protein [Thaumarchaeota archaeon]|nr:DNA-3-methyladenine glycosylase 2 family protein [Nitrososphaerota archaeon]